jgi:hypothetical protein
MILCGNRFDSDIDQFSEYPNETRSLLTAAGEVLSNLSMKTDEISKSAKT